MQIHEALWKVLYVMKCSLGVPSVMLGGVIFLPIAGILGVYAISAVCLVVYLNKHNIDNDVFVSYTWILPIHFCANLYHTQS